MNRLTDNDKTWGPFILAPWKHYFSMEWSSGRDYDDGDPRNHFRVIAFGWALQVALPNILKPFGQHARTYGFSLSQQGDGYDFLQVFFGPQTHDSRSTKSWCKFLPWKQWSCVRHSIYAPDGSHFASDARCRGSWEKFYKQKEQCPKLHFGFEDYDGELIVATCMIEEMEWHRGEGWFKRLRHFYKPMIRRSLDLHFSAEVGPEKGSWKGGTTGHGIEMLPGETPRQTFERYCAKGYEGRGRKKTTLRFIGPCEPPLPRPRPTENEVKPMNFTLQPNIPLANS